MRYFVFLALLFSAPLALAQDCQTELEGNDMLQYNSKEITVPAECTSFKIKLKHTGQLPVAQMGHNVVITATADFQEVAQSGIAAGIENGYLVPGDERVLAASDLIGGGEETTLEIDLSDWDRSEDYTFFCSFPGHSAIMNGKFVLAQ